MLSPVPALRLRLSARELEERAGRRRLRPPARLARLLRPRAPAQPRQRQATPTARARRDRVGRQRRALRRLARGPHRLSRSSTPACASSRDRLDAQPRPADHRLLPGQGPAHRLAPRRAALHASCLLDGDVAQNNGNWQWISLGRRRSRAAAPPPLQPDAPAAAPRPGRRVRATAGRPTAATWSRSSTTRSSARARSTAYAAPAARKLPRIGAFTIEPRGPFTLASAARFIAGWPPGQARRRPTTRCGCTSSSTTGAGRRSVVLTQDGDTVHADGRGRQRGARDRAGRADRLARPRRQRLPRGRRARPDRRRAAASQRLPAPGALPLALRGRRLVGDLRPHQPRAGDEAARRALARRHRSRRPSELLQLRRAATGCPANKIPRLHGIAQAALEGKLDREPLLAPDPNDAYTAAAGAAGHRPVLRRPDPAARRRHRPTSRPRASRGSSSAVQERYGAPLEDVAERWRPFRTWVSVLMRASA